MRSFTVMNDELADDLLDRVILDGATPINDDADPRYVLDPRSDISRSTRSFSRIVFAFFWRAETARRGNLHRRDSEEQRGDPRQVRVAIVAQ
jgi:hypothetical protein